MAYEVIVAPKNKAAEKALIKNYRTIDTKFQELHMSKDFFTGLNHGIELIDRSKELYPESNHGITPVPAKKSMQFIYAFSLKELGYEHVKETKKDLIKALEMVFGTRKNYTVTASM